jgi:hypothetical protein
LLPTFDSGEHAFGIGGPDEGFWIGVCFFEEAFDRILKVVEGTEDTALEAPRKARREQFKGNLTVMLIPARTDTIAFRESIYNQPNVELRFVRGRLTFGTDAYWKWVWEQEFIDGKKNSLFRKYGKKNSAPFPSMVVVFRPAPELTGSYPESFKSEEEQATSE